MYGAKGRLAVLKQQTYVGKREIFMLEPWDVSSDKW